MTEPQVAAKPARKKVEFADGSRLTQLIAMYDELKPVADEAEARLKTVIDAIKMEAAALAPGEPKLDIVSNGVALELDYSETWRIDSKGLKSADPLTYVKWARKSGSWTLRRAKA